MVMFAVILGYQAIPDFIKGIKVLLCTVMNSHADLGGFETIVLSTGMKDKVDGDKSDILDQIFMDYRAVVKARLKALQVGCDV
jgi:hypothetical protein